MKKFKNRKRGGRSIKTAVEIFSRSTEDLRRATLLCCDLENFQLRECLWISRWEEFSNSSVDYVLSHSADTIRRGSF